MCPDRRSFYAYDDYFRDTYLSHFHYGFARIAYFQHARAGSEQQRRLITGARLPADADFARASCAYRFHVLGERARRYFMLQAN